MSPGAGAGVARHRRARGPLQRRRDPLRVPHRASAAHGRELRAGHPLDLHARRAGRPRDRAEPPARRRGVRRARALARPRAALRVGRAHARGASRDRAGRAAARAARVRSAPETLLSAGATALQIEERIADAGAPNTDRDPSNVWSGAETPSTVRGPRRAFRRCAPSDLRCPLRCRVEAVVRTSARAQSEAGGAVSARRAARSRCPTARRRRAGNR